MSIFAEPWITFPFTPAGTSLRNVPAGEGSVMPDNGWGLDKERSIENSSGWEKLASKFHDRFKEIVAPYKNVDSATAEIKRIVEKVPDSMRQGQWIYPSDH